MSTIWGAYQRELFGSKKNGEKESYEPAMRKRGEKMCRQSSKEIIIKS